MDDFLLRFVADYLVIVVALAGGVVMLLVPAAQRYGQWARAVMAGLLALLSAKVASLLYQGERPFQTLGVEPGAAFLPNPGFPSDHALLVFTVACVVWAVTKNVPLSVVLFVAATLVSFGRVAALVHTPLDVIGGAICAIFAAACIYGRQFFTAKRQI
jgi:undecaprenyl-diphosphatase